MCHRVTQRLLCVCTFSQVISLRLPSHSHTVSFENEVFSGGRHMESGFYRFREASMCMSTASVESTVREGFDASGRSVHTILDLWNIHHKCCETQLSKPLHSLHPFRNLEIQKLQDFVNTALTSTFSLMSSTARRLRCQLFWRMLALARTRLATVGPSNAEQNAELVLQNPLSSIIERGRLDQS